MEDIVLTLEVILLVSLRVVRALAFAPPFPLLRIPPTIRVLACLGLGMALVAGEHGALTAELARGVPLLPIAAGELLVGGAIALSLQLAFSAILWAGGVANIEAGFGLAMVADPTTRA